MPSSCNLFAYLFQLFKHFMKTTEMLILITVFDLHLKASFNNVFTFKKDLSYMPLHAISVFGKL